MRTLTAFTFCIVLLLLSGFARAQRNYPPQIPEAAQETYKTVGDVKLNLWIFNPQDHKASDSRAAVVFFFGGGWNSGTPQQFVPQCQHLAKRGMVAMVADYRVASRHKVKADKCVADAKSAVRYVRTHAERLGIDPERIAAGGGSAGGHLAACTGIVPDFEDEETDVSSRPNALALFNPAVILAPVGPDPTKLTPRVDKLADRLGADPIRLSPYHQIAKGAPPTIIFHGKEDKVVPYTTVDLFTDRMKEMGNRCELVGYADKGHGFFNAGRGDQESYESTLEKLDAFFVSLGYLK